MSLFLTAADINQREKDLLKAIPENELLLRMPGQIKISAPHLEIVKKSISQRVAEGIRR
jgi:hypothetical protein